jgi:hypothetical protein
MSETRLNAKWQEISLPLFREAINSVEAKNVVCIRIHPTQMQRYEEQGFAMQRLPVGPDGFCPEQFVTIEGCPVEETLSQSPHSIDFIGFDGRTILRIHNVEFYGFDVNGYNREDIIATARRGLISYRTLEHMLAKLEQGAA